MTYGTIEQGKSSLNTYEELQRGLKIVLLEG